MLYVNFQSIAVKDTLITIRGTYGKRCLSYKVITARYYCLRISKLRSKKQLIAKKQTKVFV